VERLPAEDAVELSVAERDRLRGTRVHVRLGDALGKDRP
jgi:hypothetical protein